MVSSTKIPKNTYCTKIFWVYKVSKHLLSKDSPPRKPRTWNVGEGLSGYGRCPEKTGAHSPSALPLKFDSHNVVDTQSITQATTAQKAFRKHDCPLKNTTERERNRVGIICESSSVLIPFSFLFVVTSLLEFVRVPLLLQNLFLHKPFCVRGLQEIQHKYVESEQEESKQEKSQQEIQHEYVEREREESDQEKSEWEIHYEHVESERESEFL
jgi:hypothetical protein